MVASSKKASPKKKTTVKKAPAKKPVAKKRTASARTRKPQPMQSFKLYKESPSEFKSFKISRQTIYWTILLAFIMVTQLWILKIQLDIAEITNSLSLMQ